MNLNVDSTSSTASQFAAASQPEPASSSTIDDIFASVIQSSGEVDFIASGSGSLLLEEPPSSANKTKRRRKSSAKPVAVASDTKSAESSDCGLLLEAGPPDAETVSPSKRKSTPRKKKSQAAEAEDGDEDKTLELLMKAAAKEEKAAASGKKRRYNPLLRKNIKQINEGNLDAEAILAQKAEKERLQAKQSAFFLGQELEHFESASSNKSEGVSAPILDVRANHPDTNTTSASTSVDIVADSLLKNAADAIEAKKSIWLKDVSADEPNVITLSSSDEEDTLESRYQTVLPKLAPRPGARFQAGGGGEDSDDSDIVCLGNEEEANASDGSGSPGKSPTKKVAEEVQLHVDDSLNVPDAQGRMLINVNHPASDPDIFLIQHLVRFLKPHQLGGLRFLYDNIVVALHNFNKNQGYGCILAHSMGLGKTLQVVAFTDILYRFTPIKRVQIIVPINTLQNWVQEFERWLPKTVPDDSEVTPRAFEVFVLSDNLRNLKQRADVIGSWYRSGGVLLLGYEMFRLLTTTRQPASNNSNEFGGRRRGVDRFNFANFAWLNAANSKTGPPPGGFSEDSNSLSCPPSVRPASAAPGGGEHEDGSSRESPSNGMKTSASAAAFEDANNAVLAEEVRGWLLNPGPDLVVCDEGHKIKSLTASVAKALNSIRTKRRIILTGYPLQNNLTEYYCMVNFIRPNYLGSRKQFSNMFERPIMNGQCLDSTPQDVRLMQMRTHVLNFQLKGFVQRRTHSILHHMLPEKREYVLFVRKSPVQQLLYKRFMVYCRGDLEDASESILNPLKAFAVCCKIWNHPDILCKFVRSKGALPDFDLDIPDPGVEEPIDDLASLLLDAPTGSTGPSVGGGGGGGSNKRAKSGGGGRANKRKQPMQATSMEDDFMMMDDGGFQPFKNKRDTGIQYDWAEDVLANYVMDNVNNGFKFVLALNLIELSVMRGDKILLFSQSLLTLTLFEEYLSRRLIPGTTETWRKNCSYFRLDGSTSSSDRERLISRFNCERHIHLFLISTRAGSLGINLTGANRVIVLDASWNPCHDAQAVCRVFRYGQAKACFVYRLVTDNSMERAIFNRQIGKQSVSERVVDQRQVQTKMSAMELYNLMQYDEEKDTPKFPAEHDISGVADDVLVTTCRTLKECLAKEPVPHESLLLDRSEQQQLTDRQKREARREYKHSLRMMNGGGILYPPPGGVLYQSTGNYCEAKSKFKQDYAILQKPKPPSYDDHYHRSAYKPSAIVRPLVAAPLPMPLQRVAGQSAFAPSGRLATEVTSGGRLATEVTSGGRLATEMPHADWRSPRFLDGGELPPHQAQTAPGEDRGNQRKYTVHMIVIHKQISLPKAQEVGAYVLTEGQHVALVKTQNGVYIRTNEGVILNAIGSVFDDRIAPPNVNMTDRFDRPPPSALYRPRSSHGSPLEERFPGFTGLSRPASASHSSAYPWAGPGPSAGNLDPLRISEHPLSSHSSFRNDDAPPGLSEIVFGDDNPGGTVSSISNFPSLEDVNEFFQNDEPATSGLQLAGQQALWSDFGDVGQSGYGSTSTLSARDRCLPFASQGSGRSGQTHLVKGLPLPAMPVQPSSPLLVGLQPPKMTRRGQIPPAAGLKSDTQQSDLISFDASFDFDSLDEISAIGQAPRPPIKRPETPEVIDID